MSENAHLLPMEVVHQQIAIRHLEQLKDLDLPEDIPHKPLPDETSDMDSLTQGVKKTSALSKPLWPNHNPIGCYGGTAQSPINWSNVFLSFMESCATYLRDTTAVVKAVIAYRQGDIELALEFYNASITQIKKLAAIWGMGFEMFCDLVDEHPEKHRLWDGPFCGGFYSLDKTKPFIGIGFKGTNPSRMGEVLVDWNYQFIQAESGVLFDAHVSTGVYTGLFTKFKSAPDTPMALADLAANISTTSSMVHVTGHSLGGSYSTLCFAELLRHSSLGQLPPKCTLGDIYTYGSPRLAQRDLGDNYVKYLKNGSSWRIVNDNDLVPQVPPVKPSSDWYLQSHQQRNKDFQG
ncbi:hypothetical protein FRB93_008212 [Tulasnella sp. JGI-2019a]|nr:hypothetical protein FRB93_008212 [Tulasnella sp. JGI-2019a]